MPSGWVWHYIDTPGPITGSYWPRQVSGDEQAWRSPPGRRGRDWSSQASRYIIRITGFPLIPPEPPIRYAASSTSAPVGDRRPADMPRLMAPRASTLYMEHVHQYRDGERPCRCGHPRSAHLHYRPGTECSLCPDCGRYRSAQTANFAQWLRGCWRRCRALDQTGMLICGAWTPPARPASSSSTPGPAA
jgi:hypothetical protein